MSEMFYDEYDTIILLRKGDVPSPFKLLLVMKTNSYFQST